MKEFRSVKLTGAVQGVGFRYFAKALADELGVRGFARNEPDGGVYLEAEGGRAALENFFDACRTGPQGARIETIEIREGAPKGFKNFSVR